METNSNPSQTALPTSRATPAVGAGGSSYLGPNLRIQGDISGNEDLRVEGALEGSITLGGYRLTVGPKSRVDGEIKVREAVVLGEVNGNIYARDRLEIKNGSSVEGDLSTARIQIEDGAYFKGGIEIDSSNTQVGADLDTLLSQAKPKS
jgi:cytoskeletal protein CcmA (bactofilin family)